MARTDPWKDPVRRAAMELWTGPVAAGPIVRPDDRRRRRLIKALLAAGAAGGARVLLTGDLSPGCANCLSGRGACLSLTHECTRDCFFCPNPRPRGDVLTLDGKALRPQDVVRRARRLRLRGLGISGGEPLLRLDLALELIRALKASLGKSFYIHLYSNGDLATDRRLALLAQAGLDEIRFDLAANGYDVAPVRRAARVLRAVGVELPVIPEHLPRLKRLVLQLDKAGARFFTAQELYSCAGNRERLADRRYGDKPGWTPVYSRRRPVAGSDEAILELMLFAAKRCRRLSVFRCTADVKEHVIGPASWAWRSKTRRAAARKSQKRAP